MAAGPAAGQAAGTGEAGQPLQRAGGRRRRTATTAASPRTVPLLAGVCTGSARQLLWQGGRGREGSEGCSRRVDQDRGGVRGGKVAAGAAPAAVRDAGQEQGDVPALCGCQEEQRVAGAGGEERVGDN